ncbi:MAG: Lon protease family protein [Desulfobacterales bacterium]
MLSRYAVDASRLRRICDPAEFRFKSTRELEPLDEVIGQERAVEAIEFGLRMNSSGYHLFVTGLVGTGRTTIVRDIVNRHARELPPPEDWILVHNFKDAYRPQAFSLPPGRASAFCRTLNKLVSDLRRELPRAFRTKAFNEKRSAAQEGFERKKEDLFQKLRDEAAGLGLAVNRTNVGYQTIALKDGQPITQEAYEALPEPERNQIRRNMRVLQSLIENTDLETQKIQEAEQEAIDELTREVALYVVKARIEVIRKAFGGVKAVQKYLETVQDDILENVNAFVPRGNGAGADVDAEDGESVFDFDRYNVNVLSDLEDRHGAPVVFEPNPTYPNLFGQIERRGVMGQVRTDFNQVKGGSLLRANGGFLIMEIEPVLSNPHVWEALKRALQTRRLYIEDLGPDLGFGTASLRPEPIDLQVKVILLGNYDVFEMLQNLDSKFDKLFKVRADFDWEVDHTPRSVALYARFIARVCREEKLLPFSPDAVAVIVEIGERLVAHQNKLSLRFGAITGYLKESDYWARAARARRVTGKHVRRAVRERRFRYSLYEEKLRESLVDETVLLEVDGQRTGQVNALAVYQMGDQAFGRPNRITAEVYLGKPGVVSIERESELSGRTHDKGVLILTGYLGRTFAQKFPLSVCISIAFEQSYGEIDGDSASSTELYAILSSLSDLPIRQGIAVTGSVDQKGRIQSIGGVNEKIEGFFDICARRGLTGDQGVMIPKSNVQNLMLRASVVQAVREGKFHIFEVGSVAEGIEILTGVEAGAPDKDGGYPPESVYGRAEARLLEYHRLAVKIPPQTHAPGMD